MNNLLIWPLLVPLLTAAVLVLFRKKIAFQRWVSAIGSIAGLAVALVLVAQVKQNGIQTLFMSGWAPPYGIVFVADMTSALLILATALIGMFIVFFSIGSIDNERQSHFYFPLLHFLLVGVSGSFLTGDIFNLFVCFEVMLISSYALIVLGGTKLQLKETIKYVLINVVSSTLFVAAVAYLYGVTGALNMADLSVKVAEAGQDGILNVIAILFLIVFSLKAGLLLFFWLPGSYSAPPAAVIALFGALLTKVGVYTLVRVFTLIFNGDPAVTHTWIAWMAGVTMIMGALGALAYRDIPRILNYNVIISIGFIAFGLATANADALSGVVFYLLHDMAAKALLFILGGLIIQAAGTGNLDEMGGLLKRHPALGWMFFVTALALAGIPPLSGFPGKLQIITGGFAGGHYWLAAISLLTSFIVLYSLVRVFMAAFWGEERKKLPLDSDDGKKRSLSGFQMNRPGLLLPAAGLLIIIIAMGVGAEWIYPFVEQAGHTLLNPAEYVQAILKE
ncbi:Na+/H+ antiporter subunit D [Paenibacillus oryzae]|uniref:Na+/H+ antiporter subunit D n=1 Tax=Paenibacillus oryzae TaxID=1844972 RepID=A0A1A5YEH3_9BACL|nr:Na+/H+ antiporter subunit D [Paenibacillus oryzae]OBR64036.1 Na+/H+ antiporter subunit D [Paenibacillus oryzae]